MPLGTITLTGTWLQANGQAATGSVLIAPTTTVVDPTNDDVYPVAPVTATLTSGSISISNVPVISQVDPGYTYTLTQRITGAVPQSYILAIPDDASGTVDIADVITSTPPALPTGVTAAQVPGLAPVQSVDGLTGAVDLSASYAPLDKVNAALDLNAVVAWDSLRGSGALGTAPSGQTWSMLTAGSFTRTASGVSVDSSSDRYAVINATSLAGPEGAGLYIEAQARVWKRAASGIVGLVIGCTDFDNLLVCEVSNGALNIRKRVGGSETTSAANASIGTTSTLVQGGLLRATLRINPGTAAVCTVEHEGITAVYTTTDSTELTAFAGTNVGIRSNLTQTRIMDFSVRRFV